jgi:hypothetical protein
MTNSATTATFASVVRLLRMEGFGSIALIVPDAEYSGRAHSGSYGRLDAQRRLPNSSTDLTIRRVRRLGLVLLVCGVLAGCDGSSGGGAQPAPTDPTTTTTSALSKEKADAYRRDEACALRKKEALLAEAVAVESDPALKRALQYRLDDVQHAISLLDPGVVEAACSN